MSGIYPTTPSTPVLTSSKESVTSVIDTSSIQPNLGAIIPTARGRKIAYAIFALISFVVGNAVVFFAATSSTIPVWLIGATAVITNSAPAFSALAIANAIKPVAKTETVVSESVDGFIDTSAV